MDFKVTQQDLWLSTLLFASLGLALLIPLIFVFRDDSFQASARAIAMASTFFWGPLIALALFGFWGLYYRYFYPPWSRWLMPLDVVLYVVLCLGLWWLTWKLPGPGVLWFALLGGMEGIAEHLLGVYAFHILEKVPWLHGLSPFPVVVFSFFEYVFYWTVVGWLAFGLTKLIGI